MGIKDNRQRGSKNKEEKKIVEKEKKEHMTIISV